MNEQILKYLNGLDGATGASHTTTFRVYFDDREATVEISDGGPLADQARYNVFAQWSDITNDEIISGDGRALGGPASSLDKALDDVNWWVFRSTS